LLLLQQHNVPAIRLGEVTSADTLAITASSETFTWPLATLHHAWADTIGELMES